LRVTRARVAQRELRRAARHVSAVDAAVGRHDLAVAPDLAVGIGPAVRLACGHAAHVVAAEAVAVLRTGRRAVAGSVANSAGARDDADVLLTAWRPAGLALGRPGAGALTVARAAAAQLALALQPCISPQLREAAGARRVGAAPAGALADALAAGPVDAVAGCAFAVPRARRAVGLLPHDTHPVVAAVHTRGARGIRSARSHALAGARVPAVAGRAESRAGVDAADAVDAEGGAALARGAAGRAVGLQARLTGAGRVAVLPRHVARRGRVR